MAARVKVSAPGGDSVDLVLTGPAKAVKELVDKLRKIGGPLDVAGAQCAFALSNNGSTLHVLLDMDE